VALAPWAQVDSTAASGFLALTHVTVIDGTGRPPQPDMTVLIHDGRIAAIGPTGQLVVSDTAEVVDASGKHLIPGLWNLHIHLGGYEGAKKSLPMLLANGITGVRDMGSPPEDILRLRGEVDSGAILGPRMLVAGPLVNGPLPPALARLPMLRSVASPVEAREAVRSLKAQGVDFIKVADSLPRNSYLALAAEARRLRIPFAGHIPPAVSAQETAEAGQASVEHLGGMHHGVLIACSSRERELRAKVQAVFRAQVNAAFEGQEPDESPLFRAALTRPLLDSYSDKKAAALFQRFAKERMWQTPTLVSLRRRWNREGLTEEDAGYRKKVIEKQVQIVGAMHRARVRILPGTDAPVDATNASLHDELGLLVEAGLTPMEALQSATRDAAEFLGKLDTLGTVEPGKFADLVLLDGDPVGDIGNTRRIAAVVVRGRLLTKAELQPAPSD